MTTSLFGTTLLVSFLVVGMPHIFPCPAPRTQFADYEITKDGRQRRRRRPSTTNTDVDKNFLQSEEIAGKSNHAMTMEEQEALRRKAHECPVPKPGGRIGEILGFPQKEEKESRRSEIIVEPRHPEG